jgi:hypothetical protein
MDYLLSRYPHGYGADTYIIFVQRDGYIYHTIHVHEYASPHISYLFEFEKEEKILEERSRRKNRKIFHLFEKVFFL